MENFSIPRQPKKEDSKTETEDENRQIPTREVIEKQTVELPDDSEFSQRKPEVLEHFENIWRQKGIHDLLGEYIHMARISEEYRDYEQKSLDTVDPDQYKHAFKSYQEFASDRTDVLVKILQDSDINFSVDGKLLVDELDSKLRDFVLKQTERNQSDPELIMKSSLEKVAEEDFGQSQHLYELLPDVSEMPAMQAIIEKLNSKFDQDFFLFLGTINNMKIKDDKFFVFDVDFCTKERSDSSDAYAHEEFRDFNYPFWISTSITQGKLNILVRTPQGEDDVELLNETYDLDKFSNYEAVFEHTAQQIIERNLIEQIPKKAPEEKNPRPEDNIQESLADHPMAQLTENEQTAKEKVEKEARAGLLIFHEALQLELTQTKGKPPKSKKIDAILDQCGILANLTPVPRNSLIGAIKKDEKFRTAELEEFVKEGLGILDLWIHAEGLGQGSDLDLEEVRRRIQES